MYLLLAQLLNASYDAFSPRIYGAFGGSEKALLITLLAVLASRVLTYQLCMMLLRGGGRIVLVVERKGCGNEKEEI